MFVVASAPFARECRCAGAGTEYKMHGGLGGGLLYCMLLPRNHEHIHILFL